MNAMDRSTRGTWKAALTSEPLVHLTAINSPDDCAIAGEATACERVTQRLGKERTLALGYDLAVHSPRSRRSATRGGSCISAK